MSPTNEIVNLMNTVTMDESAAKSIHALVSNMGISSQGTEAVNNITVRTVSSTRLVGQASLRFAPKYPKSRQHTTQ